MSQLNDIISSVVEEMISPAGRINVDIASDLVYKRAEFSHIEVCAKSEIARRIQQYMARSRKAAVSGTMAASGQGVLPLGLRPAHAIDDDGREMVLTVHMTQAQFRKVIEIREQQVIADTAYLTKLRSAYSAACPIWTAHPDWTFGQVAEAIQPEAESA
jgi:hypothetical protein